MKSGTFTSSPTLARRPGRAQDPARGELLPFEEVAALRLRVRALMDDVELVAAECRLAVALDGHAAAARCGDVVERAPDRVVGDVRKLPFG